MCDVCVWQVRLEWRQQGVVSRVAAPGHHHACNRQYYTPIELSPTQPVDIPCHWCQACAMLSDKLVLRVLRVVGPSIAVGRHGRLSACSTALYS